MTESKEQLAAAPEPVSDEIRVNVFGRTDVGMVRDHNEDNFLIADLSTRNRSLMPEVQRHTVGDLGSLFVVCDGMGGAAAGEVASQIGVDTIYEMMQKGGPPFDEKELAARLERAISEAGKRIFTAAKINKMQRGMGTTVTAAVLAGPRLIFGQIGDSRAHIVRNGRMVQTTKDQSLVQQLIDANQLTAEEAKNFDRSNIILQALGTTEEVHVDLTSVLLCQGDVLVMCSDGLSGLVEPDEILNVVQGTGDLKEACQHLTQLACDAGGDDNVTVIIARFDGDGLAPPSTQDSVAYEKFVLNEPQEVTVTKPYPSKPVDRDGADVASGRQQENTSPVLLSDSGRNRKDERSSADASSGAGSLMLVIGLILAVAGGILALVLWKSNSGSDVPAPSALPDASIPTSQTTPAPPPLPVDPPGDDAETANAESGDEPRLEPVDEQQIVNDTDRRADSGGTPDSGNESGGVVSESPQNAEKGTDNSAIQKDDPSMEQVPPAVSPPAVPPKPKKPGKAVPPKKAGADSDGTKSGISDNPYL